MKVRLPFRKTLPLGWAEPVRVSLVVLGMTCTAKLAEATRVPVGLLELAVYV